VTAGEPGMHRQSRVRLALLDEPWQRFPLIVTVAILFWCVALAGLGFFLQLEARKLPHPEALEAQIIEVPGSGFAGGGGGSPAASKHRPTSTKSNQPLAVKPMRQRPRVARTRAIPPPREDLFAAPQAKSADTHILPVPVVTGGHPNSQPSSAIASAGGNGAGGEGGVGNRIGPGLGKGAGSGPGTGSGGGFGSGVSGPTAIYAPVPTIPDDMRDEVLEAVAVAHFRVLHDGRVIVSLAKPTDYSRLNDLILDTLSEWRFHPAMNRGVAVDSEAEVRLLITVQ